MVCRDGQTAFIRKLAQGVSCLKKMNIQSGMIHLLVAARFGRTLIGPMEPVILPTPGHEEILGGWGLFGSAAIYPGEEGTSHTPTTGGSAIWSPAWSLRERADDPAKEILDELVSADLLVFDRVLP